MMASSDNLSLNNVDFEKNNAFLSTPLSEWIQTEINEINNAFSATPLIESKRKNYKQSRFLALGK